MLYDMIMRRLNVTDLNVIDLNVIDLADVRQRREAMAMRPLCKYCGADLGDGEKEEDCSGAWFTADMPQPAMKRRFRAE